MRAEEYNNLKCQLRQIQMDIETKKKSLSTYDDYIETADMKIIKLKIELKDSRMPQVIREIEAKIKNIQTGVANAKGERARIEEIMKSQEVKLVGVQTEVNAEKKILAGNYEDVLANELEKDEKKSRLKR